LSILRLPPGSHAPAWEREHTILRLPPQRLPGSHAPAWEHVQTLPRRERWHGDHSGRWSRWSGC